MQIQKTITLRVWGPKVSELPEDWEHDEFERVSRMVAEGYSSGEIVIDGADGGWWKLSTETTD